LSHIFDGSQTSGTQILEVDFVAGNSHGYLEYGLFINSSTSGMVFAMGVTVRTGAPAPSFSAGTPGANDAAEGGFMTTTTTHSSIIELVDLHGYENYFQTGRFHFENLTVGTQYRMGLYGECYTNGFIVFNSGGQTSYTFNRQQHHQCHLSFVETSSGIINNNSAYGK
tara:strand:+ start:319 stop:822 length:504 start_codon:yes stop_codon:yes gene_type:complete